MPAIAVSSGTVMRCSASSGVYPGASTLTITCTLVMSGTASIGSLVKLHSPSAATASAAIITKARCAIDNCVMRSIMMRSSVVVRSARLLDVGLDEIAVLGHVAGAGFDTAQDFGPLPLRLAQLQHANFIGVVDLF